MCLRVKPSCSGLTEGFLCLLANNAMTLLAEFEGRLTQIVTYQLQSSYGGGCVYHPPPPLDGVTLPYHFLNVPDQYCLVQQLFDQLAIFSD